MRKVAVALSNGFGNHVAFHVIEPLDRILLSILGGGRIAAFNFRRLYGAAIAKYYGLLDGVLQFTDVSVPWQSTDSLFSLWCKLQVLLIVDVRVAGEKVMSIG